MTETRKDVIRETDTEAVRLAKTLVRSARFGALAAIEPGTGAPLASRVG
ncbi:MAG: HugZ family protein, partial [Mesorhizobium sp.]